MNENSTDSLLTIHQRILKGDPAASSDLFIKAHKPLARILYKKHQGRHFTWEDAGDMATDAIVSYLANPSHYQPSRTKLLTYLTMVASGDALNLIDSRTTEQNNFKRYVELSVPERNNEYEALEYRIDAERIMKRHGEELVDDATDELILKMMMDDERITARYAMVLDVAHLPIDEQQVIVKQHQDRLKKRIKRLGERL